MPVIQTHSGSVEKPQQHKQPSRKGRKAWRKNVDVTEIESGLEERNDQLIKGGIIQEKQSSELFEVVAEADAVVAKRVAKKYTKVLRADQIIAQRSAIPAISGRKRPGDGRTTDGVLEPKRKKRADYVPARELARLRRVADGHHETTVDIAKANYDPWAVEETQKDEAHEKEGKFSFLPAAQKPKAPRTMKRAPISLAASGKTVPAVAKPKGAFSYNPAFEYYEKRLTEEGSKAVEAEKKRLEALEAERIRQEAVAKSAAEADEAEARADLSEWDEESAWEGIESGVEENANAKRPKRKTPAQRNRVIRRKQEESQKKHEAIMRRKQEQVKQMEKLLAEGREEALMKATRDDSDAESDSEDAQPDEEEETDDPVLRRRQLGKFRLPEKPLEMVLPDELEDSLRRLKPEGNLLKDRYRSMLVRGKMEARRKRPFRKHAKVKMTEKWTHKDFHLI